MKRIPYEDLQGLIAKLERDQKSVEPQHFNAREMHEMYVFDHLGPYQHVRIDRHPIALPDESDDHGNIFQTHDVWKSFANRTRNKGTMNILSAWEYTNIIVGLYEHRDDPIVRQMVERTAAISSISWNIMTLTDVQRTPVVSKSISTLFDGRIFTDTQLVNQLRTKEDWLKHLLKTGDSDSVIQAFCWFTGCSKVDVQIDYTFQMPTDITPVRFSKYGTTCTIDARSENPKSLLRELREMYIGIGARIEYHDTPK